MERLVKKLLDGSDRGTDSEDGEQEESGGWAVAEFAEGGN